MAAISITIPDAQLPRVVSALCAAGGWTAANGAQGAFARNVLMGMIRQCVINVESGAATAAAIAALPTVVDPGLT